MKLHSDLIKSTTQKNYMIIGTIIVICSLVLMVIFDWIRPKSLIAYDDFRNSAAIFLYQQGLATYLSENRPKVTRIYWNAARLVFPVMGHIWIELASLEKFSFLDESRARQILKECQKPEHQYLDYPASQCSEMLNHFDHLGYPGSLDELVKKGLR